MSIASPKTLRRLWKGYSIVVGAIVVADSNFEWGTLLDIQRGGFVDKFFRLHNKLPSNLAHNITNSIALEAFQIDVNRQINLPSK